MRLEIAAPTRWLNANDRKHRIGDSPQVKAWRAATCHAAVTAAGPAPLWPVAVVATIHKTRLGRWDAHNLYPTLKACIDGLVDAGIIPDDHNDIVTFVGIRAGEKRPRACVILDVEPS